MDDSYVDAVFEDTRDKMTRAIDHARGELAAIRTGRAAPALVEQELLVEDVSIDGMCGVY